MEDMSLSVWLVGILAQICFAGRQISQWWASEKAKSIQSPLSFWLLTLLGVTFFIVYGFMRFDLAILIGNFLNFYICCRNLYFKGFWNALPFFIQWMILILPFAIMLSFYFYNPSILSRSFYNKEIGGGFLLLGTIGYLLFSLRFIYQWYISEKDNTSRLPVGFFVMSIIGSILIISYGAYREDAILVLGYLGGLTVYFRNLYINYYLAT